MINEDETRKMFADFMCRMSAEVTEMLPKGCQIRRFSDEDAKAIEKMSMEDIENVLDLLDAIAVTVQRRLG